MSEQLQTIEVAKRPSVPPAAMGRIACAACPLFQMNACGGKETAADPCPPKVEAPAASATTVESSNDAYDDNAIRQASYKKQLADPSRNFVTANLSPKPAVKKPTPAPRVVAQKKPAPKPQPKPRARPAKAEGLWGDTISQFLAACLGATATNASSKL